MGDAVLVRVFTACLASDTLDELNELSFCMSFAFPTGVTKFSAKAAGQRACPAGEHFDCSAQAAGRFGERATARRVADGREVMREYGVVPCSGRLGHDHAQRVAAELLPVNQWKVLVLPGPL